MATEGGARLASIFIAIKNLQVAIISRAALFHSYLDFNISAYLIYRSVLGAVDESCNAVIHSRQHFLFAGGKV